MAFSASSTDWKKILTPSRQVAKTDKKEAIGGAEEYFVGHKEVPVTQLRKRVLEELERRNYSQATARAYVGAIRRFAEHFHRSPDQLGIEHVRQYQLHLVQERKLQPRTVMIQMAALRFLFLKTLKRRYSREDLPLPKTPRRQLPVVLSREEVAK